jgi:hypothetical protein
MFYSSKFALPHLAAVVLSALLLLAAFRKPGLARNLFAVLFGWAAVVNWLTVLETPRVYLEYAPLAVLQAYRDIILGAFADHIRLFVGGIATCQGLMVVGLLLGDVWARMALVGAVVFLVDIAPLGVGSGFPSTLLMACAAGVLLTRSRRSAIAPSTWNIVRGACERASRRLRHEPSRPR